MRARLQDRAARRRRERTRDALRSHPLLPLVLDASWYVARYRDVFWAGVDATEHLLGPGLDEGRDPGPIVDLSFLRTRAGGSPDDSAAALLEFLDHGVTAGRRPSPYVDLQWYAATFDDVPDDAVGALRHLSSTGICEGRDPGPFVALRAYASRVTDIGSSGIGAFAYFTALGQHLGRFPHPVWDEEGYLDTNEYVRFALGMGKHLHGFEHFCAVGHTEVARGALLLPIIIRGRSVEYSEERYLAANEDVARRVADGELPDGVTHFFSSGHAEVAAGRRSLAPPSSIATLVPATKTFGTFAPARRGRDLLLLVHHDRDAVVDPHVLTAVDAYRAADIDIAVITSGADEEARTLLHDRAVPLHSRSANDDLRDFGAWRLLLEHLGDDGLARYERVILANDSAYFPVRRPEDFLAEMRAAKSDLWSASDSFSGGRYHLQSYFLALRPRALAVLRPELERRAALHPAPTKLGLIQRFEIGLSQHAAAHGLTLGAFASVAALGDPAAAMSPPDARALSRLAVTVTNLTHHFWRHTLDQDLPFLKVELLRDNPLGVDIAGWQEMVTGPCSAGAIEAHLARVRR